MNQEDMDALIGQLSADASTLHALISVVVAARPDLRSLIERQAEAMALLSKQGLSPLQRQHFDQRMTELRPLWQSTPPG